MRAKIFFKSLSLVFAVLALTPTGRAVTFATSSQTRAPASTPVEFITAEELKEKLGRNERVTILDVRSTNSYITSNNRIKGSTHFKLRRLKDRLGFPPLKDLSRDSEIVAYCACSGDQSSLRAVQILQNHGFTRARVLKGGWNAWLKASGQVEPRPKPA